MIHLVCPGIFAPALVPGPVGQRDTGARIFFCPGTKGEGDVQSRGNTSLNYICSNLLDMTKLKKYSVTKNCSDLSLFEDIVLVISKF